MTCTEANRETGSPTGYVGLFLCRVGFVAALQDKNYHWQLDGQAACLSGEPAQMFRLNPDDATKTVASQLRSEGVNKFGY